MSDFQRDYRAPGLAAFAGVLASMIGFFNLIYGLILLFNSEWVLISEEGALFLDVTAWAWLLVIIGAVQIAVAIGIFGGRPWARVTGIAWAVLISLVQMAFLNVHPIWSLLIIAFCVLMIYALASGLGSER